MNALHVEYADTPASWCAYYDPEGMIGRGKDRERAIADLLEQTDEAWGKALDERDALRAERTDAITWTMLKANSDKWRDLAQKLTGVDANDHGWLRAELDSQWSKRIPYAEGFARAIESIRIAWDDVGVDDNYGIDGYSAMENAILTAEALAKNPTDKAVRVGAEAAGSSCDPVNVHARIAEIDAADAREAIPVGGLTLRWIPVAERLPVNPQGDIFFLTERKSRHHGCYDEGGFWAFDRGWVANVTHWMALPENPK